VGREKLCSLLPVLMDPRQCPLVHLVEASLRKGKALGSEKMELLGCGLCCEQWRAGAILRMIGINFDIKFGRAALE
jgi:hypothetical protein